jgi:hypothetical protein
MSDDRPQVRVVHHSFRYVKPGDRVRRVLGGAAMTLVVSAVDEDFIHCGPPGVGWKFDRATGIEVDEEIGWGPQFGVAGSYLIHHYEEAAEGEESGSEASSGRATSPMDRRYPAR